METYEPGWLLFASDADRLLVWGGACVIVALVALTMDRRRHKRDRIAAADRVGWMPWTMVFLVGSVLGMGLIALALSGGS